MSNRRARLRLLFDENLPWRVAEALRILEYRVSYVGMKANHDSAPPRGSSDEEVLEYAQHTNRIVVTSDLGMVMLCAEAGHRVIWIDPRGCQLRRVDMVFLVFKQIHDWEERLERADGPICLQAMRTTTKSLDLGEAARFARGRMRQIRPARKPRKRTTPLGPLYPQEAVVTRSMSTTPITTEEMR
ncbi:MAG: DUF5615 family PIN-like protein [bacterium]|nr:DUF5615 family PIN-like protein [bacterium]